LCPAGRYGSSVGEYRLNCTGVCVAGWYCSSGSIRSGQSVCGNVSVYCPEGSGAPITVSLGYYTTGNDPLDYNSSFETFSGNQYLNLHRTSQSICELGHYCSGDGTKCRQFITIAITLNAGFQTKCPAGKFGSERMLTNSSCSGFCKEGYYCDAGAISQTQRECGDANHFCPRGSGAPHQVDEGYYSTGGSNTSTRTLQKKCEPGFWCKDGVKYLCEPGYYGQDFGLVSGNLF
jgi:hypothetical protein